MSETVPGYPIYINKIALKATEESIKEIFSTFGEIIYCKLNKKNHFRRIASAIISYKTEEEKILAKHSMNGGMIENITVIVRDYLSDFNIKEKRNDIEDERARERETNYKENDRISQTNRDNNFGNRMRRGDSRQSFRERDRERGRSRGRSPPKYGRYGPPPERNERGSRELSSYVPKDRGDYYESKFRGRGDSRKPSNYRDRRNKRSRSRSYSPRRSRSPSPAYRNRSRSRSRSSYRSPSRSRSRSASRN